MMPSYQSVPLDYQPWEGQQPVFRVGKETFRASEYRQVRPAEGSSRQLHFEEQLHRIARATGTSVVPIYIRWAGGSEMRLDRGCVGHAIRRGFLEPVTDSENGYVSHVIIREGAHE